nr:retrovirus-related Pol polyprotein from transposon TNT 1-94 [Tanacetum cinerariifolium]
MAIEESKDLTSLSLDELIENLKVHEMIIKKDSEIVKAKVERKSIALKAKKEYSDEECLTYGSKDEERSKEAVMTKMVEVIENALDVIGLCPKPPKNKNQRAFVRGSWSNTGEEDDEKVKDESCLVAHASRKQAHDSHKANNVVSTTRCLELLHMDVFGPSDVWSYRGNCYTLVIVDDYSRYTWTRLLKDKIKAFDQFEIFSRKIQNQLGCSIMLIRNDHGREFDNEVQFKEFCNANGITHNFSAPCTPHSNGVVEKKNRTL